MKEKKLFMLLLGARPKGRLVEQHDFFFGIGETMKDLIPSMKTFWPEAKSNLHIDAWREINYVNGFKIKVADRKGTAHGDNARKIFFINLGGYKQDKFEEQHYTILTVSNNKFDAIVEAKRTLFFKENTMEKAVSHIDDKYGIDVDDFYNIEELLSSELLKLYEIEITESDEKYEDEMHLGYLPLHKVK